MTMTNQTADEAKRLRGRDEERLGALTRREPAASFGSLSLVAQTRAIKTYPTSPQRFYACVAQTVLGREVEGGPAILSASPATFFALNLGTAVPPVGTAILATFVESRWVFRFDG